MKILGDKLKSIRKSKGMSQTELADGICTQATISLIEKKHQVPSTKILLTICQRLGIEMSTVVEQDEDHLHLQFDELQRYLINGDYTHAKPLMQTIDINEIKGRNDLKRFYCAKGVLKMLADKQPDDALFFYNRALQQSGAEKVDMYDVLCTLGVGSAYLAKGLTDRAESYANQVHDLLTHNPDVFGPLVPVQLGVFLDLADIYLTLRRYQLAIEYAKKTIEIDLANKSLYLLDKAYLVLGKAESTSGNSKGADTLEIAETLAKIRQHHLIE